MDPLAELRDITIPLQPDWWPPAPGWWILILIVMLVVLKLLRVLKRSIDKKRPFKQARNAITQWHQAYVANTLQADEYVENLNQLLKRVTLFATGDTLAAPLSGDNWLDYLDNISGGTEFSTGPGKVLGTARYRKEPNYELADIHTQVLNIVRKIEKNA